MKNEISRLHSELKNHSLYTKLNTIESIQIFMKYHAFAVWDFMSLLKSLQRKITCVEIPWHDSNYDPMLVQLINEIVLGEESDCDQYGTPTSHYSLYLKAMHEIGADTNLINSFIHEQDFNLLPKEVSDIVSYHLDLAREGKVHEVASSFFYGREKLIPDMFTSIIKVLEDSKVDCPTLVYYFKRHIEVDSDNHGPKALICLDRLTDTDLKANEAFEVAQESLKKRYLLWDFIEDQIINYST